jgi:ABC-type transport system involved in multi-copper enzyme maturation permease subunit
VEAEAAVSRRFIVLCAVVALALLATALRVLVIAGANTPGSPAAVGSAFVFGLWVPLAVLLYAIRRRRIAVVALAFCLGLSVNVVFLANAVPANAAANNSSTFYWTLGSGFGCTAGTHDAPQTNLNDGATGPGSAGRTYTDCSDTFSSGQSLQAGTTVANLNFWNTSASKDCTINAELQHYHAASATVTSLGTSGTITVLANTNTLTAFNWSWSTSAATFAGGDRLYFLMTFTGAGSNCNNTTLSYTTLANPTYFTVAMIVPEHVAGLLPLALALPLAARWWKRRRP